MESVDIISGAVGALMATTALSDLPPLPNGSYQVGDCSAPPTEAVLQIDGNHLYFYESLCELERGRRIDGIESAVL